MRITSHKMLIIECKQRELKSEYLFLLTVVKKYSQFFHNFYTDLLTAFSTKVENYYSW